MDRISIRMMGLFMFIYSSSLYTEESSFPFSLDYLYPESKFYRIEISCKELWSDLDSLLESKTFFELYTQNANNLWQQFVVLSAVVEDFVNHDEESRAYLREDIQYLTNLLAIIEEKYQRVRILLDPAFDSGMIETMYRYLIRSKNSLHTMLMAYQEYPS